MDKQIHLNAFTINSIYNSILKWLETGIVTITL